MLRGLSAAVRCGTPLHVATLTLTPPLRRQPALSSRSDRNARAVLAQAGHLTASATSGESIESRVDTAQPAARCDVWLEAALVEYSTTACVVICFIHHHLPLKAHVVLSKGLWCRFSGVVKVLYVYG